MASTGSITLARKGLAAIETLRALDGRTPDEQQRAVLADWPGWGPLAPAFDPEPEGTWEAINDRLTDLLSLAEMTSAAECVDNAFYTSPLVVDTVWSLLREAGFEGGRVLEPGCGSGRFLAGAPDGLDIRFTGVERDLISAQIAAAVHPQAEIIAGRFEKSSPKAGFDAVVGNVPFSASHVSDGPSGIADNLHNYFILRSLDLLREGGYLAVVTSRYSLDSKRSILGKVRDKADFVGALRLPSGAFRGEGTEVVADIVLLRKNSTRARAGWVLPVYVPEDGSTETDLYTCFGRRKSPDPYGYSAYYPRSYSPEADEFANPPSKVLCYWAEHPEHVAGTMTQAHNRYHPITVDAADIGAEITRAAAALAEKVRALPMFDDGIDPLEFEQVVDAEGRKEGSFHLLDGQVMRVQRSRLTPVPRAGKELAALIGLRDLAVDLLAAEADPHAPDSSMADLRAETLAAYQAYVARYGALNRGALHEGRVDEETGAPSLTWKRPTLGGFRADPDYVLVMALEKFDQATGDCSPAAILLGRVNAAPTPITSADGPDEALVVTLGESGRVDLARIAGLLGLPDEAAAETALGERVYRDPAQTGTVVTARDYLSGNVRAKHAEAVRAAAADPAYARNVTALDEVRPDDLGPGQIGMRLGNPCLTAADIDAFLSEVVGGWARVEHCAVTATWRVDGHGGTEGTTTWGIPEMPAHKLVECALNGKAPVVYEDKFIVGRGHRKVRNPDLTLVAQEKMTLLQDRFASWVWEDPDRSDRVCALYNQRFNSYVARVCDGTYLTFPGMSEVFTPHPWQRNMVDRAVSTPAVLCGHCVGSGKTLTMALTAVTLRRFGLARKPLVVVPNHLLEQISREMQQAFPLGKFLIAAKEDLAKDARRLFAARCATGDWDAVVMTHQAFTSLPVHPRTEEAWVAAQKAEYDAHLRSGTGGYAGAKEIARKVRSLETRLEAIRSNAVTDPDQVLFEHLGIDYIMVDEAHLMKRLPINSRAEGFSMGASKRATDLLLKSQTLAERRPGKPHLALFTGTPWTNTLAETFVWQKFLQPDVLTEAGVADFDAWAAVFVKRETVVEVSPDGSGFRVATRPTKMTNLPELQTMLGQVADILTADDIDLERPERVLHPTSVEPTDMQRQFVAHLVERAEGMRNTRRDTVRAVHDGDESVTPAKFPTPANDNMLVVCGDGRRVALDPRLVGIDDDSPKVAAAAERIATLYHQTRFTPYGDSDVPGMLQVVFCDQGTPSKEEGGQTYGRLRDMLVASGVAASRIRMIHEAKDDKSRAALFAACRDGSVSVLIGSTEKMGMGTNIQTRLGTIHHLDAPWRPSDIEQREGRALRPGNLNESVSVYRYVTEGTFDAYMWQTLERKALGFVVMYSKRVDVREVDDIGEVVPDYTQMKALATGNPLLLEQATLVAEVKRLRTLRAIDGRNVVAARKNLTRLRSDRAAVQQRWERVSAVSTDPDWERVRADVAETLVESTRQAWKGAYGDYFHTYGLNWRGNLQVKIDRNENGKIALAILTSSYREVDRIVLTKTTVLLRGARRKAVALVGSLLEEWADTLDERVDRMARRMAEMDAEIVRTERVVDDYRFAQQDVLDGAVERLAAIEAEMSEQATDREAA